MLKRSLIVAAIALSLMVAAKPIPTVYAVLMSEAELAVLDASTTREDSAKQSKDGNAFVRALKAPFKAIGRMFGAGKKDDGKLHRLSEKDVKKFESAGVLKVQDATLVPSAESANTRTNPAPDLGAAPPTKEQADKIASRQNVATARSLMNQGKVNEALTSLNSAISLDSKNGEAHNLMAIAYEAKGMRERAFKEFELALKYSNAQPEFLSNLGYLYFKNGEYDKAAKYLRRAVKAAPEQQRYWNNLGLVEAQRNNFDEAYNAFAHAVGEYQGHLNIANRLQANGNDGGAIKHLELARAIKPNSKEILVRLISLYKRTGQAELAEETRKAFVSASTFAAAPEK
ncbi:MAG TPA: tetratricopeptide repeat protein [Pyrinomonadaceae bacterium]|nr:tetratricopeptide repeat protein [Pyrinomonadaceae bacterium]